MKILGMGNALVDVLTRIDDDKLLDSLCLPKGSMQLIDRERMFELNKELENLNKDIVAGGSAANTIVGLSRLGIDTGFVGRVGVDTYGQYYKEDLLLNGVKLHMSEVEGEMSGVATTLISADGQRTFGTYLGAAALLAAEELNESDFRGYDYFYIEGYLVQSYELIERAIVLAREAGAKVILDLASYNVVEEHKEFLIKIISRYVDVVFANEEEAEALYGVDAGNAVSLLAKQTRIAVVKAGSKGSWMQSGNEKIFVVAREVNCIDSTGAGDLYAAGFIFGLMKSCPLRLCGEIGTLLATTVIQVIGPKIDDDTWADIKPQVESWLI